MTTSTNSAAGIGLPEKPFNAGRYLIAGNSINLQPAGAAHVVYIVPAPDDPELPRPEQWLAVWRMIGNASHRMIIGIREAIEASIIEEV